MIRSITAVLTAGVSVVAPASPVHAETREYALPAGNLKVPVAPNPADRPLTTALHNAVLPQQPSSPAQVPFHLEEATIADVHRAIISHQITCRQLVELYLRRIKAYDHDHGLNAIQAVNPHAIENADRLDQKFAATGGLTGPLHCIPVAVKDQIETRDMPTTYGSAAFRNFVPKRDATVVARLREAGAIILAKNTMGEFGNSYLSSMAGIIRNAYDPTRTASGSSGGTGVAVTANLAMVGIGADVGGSIRGPAAFGSLVGLRPTVALVSHYGVMPAMPTRDTVGPITRTVADAAAVLDVIAGYDPDDAGTAPAFGHHEASYNEFLIKDGLRGARIGIVIKPMNTRADPSSDDYKKVRTVIDRAIADMKSMGAEIVDSPLPELKDVAPENDFETEEAMNSYLAEQPNAPFKTLREILLSGKVLPQQAKGLLDSVGRTTHDPGYLELLLMQNEMREHVLKLMADNKLDALLYATSDHQPTKIPADVLTNPNAKDDYNRGSNRRLSPFLGFPAITVPAGFTTDGLPVGIEFMGRPYSEGLLLKLAYAYEQATHRRRVPPSAPALVREP